jgi:hypothetical protein
VLDLEVADLEDILGDEAAERAGAVADLKLGTVLLVSRRGRRVVLGVEVAGNRVAALRGDPEVGASRVENDLEGLGRRTERNLREVWGLLVLATPCCGTCGAAKTYIVRSRSC